MQPPRGIRVLVVEDDRRLRDVLARALRSAGFAVGTAADGASALRSVEPVPDAIVLDVGLPDSDGRDVCQALRSRGVDVPVIFLGPQPDVADRRVRFESGCDDYLAKPFAFAELVARLRAALLRGGALAAGAAGHPPLQLDPLARALRWQGHSVDLSPIEYRLLARLLVQPDAVVRRRELREAGWPTGGIVAENTLDQYMTKLRRKLGRLRAPFVLRATRGVGYRLVPEERTR